MSLYAQGLTAPATIGSAELFPDPLRKAAEGIMMARRGFIGLHREGAYRLGSSPAFQKPAVGQLIANPAFIQNEVRRLWSEAEGVGREIRAHWEAKGCEANIGRPRGENPECDRLNTFIESAWSPFLFELDRFTKEHQDRFFNWGSTLDTVALHRQRLIALRASAEKLGVEFVGAPPQKPEPGTFEKLGEMFFSLIKIVFFAVVGLGGLYLIISYLGRAS